MSDNKPFSIIIADSMEAVEKIHAVRELPPLVSWKEESDRLEAEAQAANPTAPTLTAGHLKAGYLMKLRDATLYVLVDEQILRQQDAMRAAGFPEKAFFVANECWIHIDGYASNIRDRTDPHGMVKIDQIPKPFDLLSKWATENDPTDLRITLTSRKQGYIATLIDSNSDDLYRCLDSIVEHMTSELSRPSEYSVHPLLEVVPEGHVMTLPAETWVMLRTLSNGIVNTLGCFTDEAGAKAALEYLKSNTKQ